MAIEKELSTIDIGDFAGQALSARFTITMPPGHETLNVVIPWNERTFQFTSKQNTLTLVWAYDKNDFQKPWRITAPSGAVDLTFTPFMERVAASDLLLVKSEVHQMFGRYHGTISTAEGETIPINKLLGWAEDRVAKW